MGRGFILSQSYILPIVVMLLQPAAWERGVSLYHGLCSTALTL